MSTKEKLSLAEAGRILGVVKKVDAPPAKIRTAFLSVMGEELRSTGLTIDEVREAMSAAEDMGVGGGDEPVAEAPAPAKQTKVAGSKLNGKAKAAPKPAAAPKKAAAKTEKPKAAPRVKAAVETDPRKLLAALKKEDAEKWGRVEAIEEVSSAGKPLRVTIRCIDPETEEPIKGNAGLRSIKVQDMFQVRYTVDGAKRARLLARSAKRTAVQGKKAAPKAPAKQTRGAKALKAAKAKK